MDTIVHDGESVSSRIVEYLRGLNNGDEFTSNSISDAIGAAPEKHGAITGFLAKNKVRGVYDLVGKGAAGVFVYRMIDAARVADIPIRSIAGAGSPGRKPGSKIDDLHRLLPRVDRPSNDGFDPPPYAVYAQRPKRGEVTLTALRERLLQLAVDVEHYAATTAAAKPSLKQFTERELIAELNRRILLQPKDRNI